MNVAERWDIKSIAEYLGVRPKHTRDKVTKRPDFPKPVVNASRRTRFWLAEEVKRWATGGPRSPEPSPDNKSA